MFSGSVGRLRPARFKTLSLQVVNNRNNCWKKGWRYLGGFVNWFSSRRALLMKEGAECGWSIWGTGGEYVATAQPQQLLT